MRNNSPVRLIVVIVSVLVVSGTIPTAAVGAFADDPIEPREAISGDGFQDVSDNVEVWDRAALPLRVDSDDAETKVQSVDQMVSIGSMNIDRARLDMDEITVYDDEAELTLEFQSKTFASTGDFAGQDAQLLAAHVEGNNPAIRDALNSESPATARPLLGLLTSEGVTFDLVENYGSLDSNGELTGEYDLADENEGPGFYVFFLVQDYDEQAQTWGVTDSGFEESNGDLSVSGDGRVLGVDTALVHGEESTASPQSQTYAAGSDVTFDVAGDEGDTTHAVVVYDEEEFANRDVITEIDGELDGDVDASQVTVRREIGAVNGVAAIDGPSNVPGIGSIGDGRVSGVFSGARLIEFVAEQANVEEPLDATTDDPVTLDASVTVTQNGDVAVETLPDWDPGQYRYLHIAVHDETSEITTTSGSVTITSAKAASRNLNGERETTLTMPSGSSVSELDFQFSGPISGTVTVSERDVPPSEVASLNQQENVRDPVYLDISAPNDAGETTITATVQKSSLDGIDPSDLSLWHNEDGSWVELDTTVVSQTGTTVTIRAVTPGFSSFAIGESSQSSVVQPSGDTDGDGGDDALLRQSLDGVSSVDLTIGDASETLQRVSMSFSGQTSGEVTIREFDRPTAYTDYPRDDDVILTVVDLQPPSDVRYDEGTVTFELTQSALESHGVSADELQIERYDSSTGWETLETEVVSSDDEIVTLRTDVPDFGTYVISTTAAQQVTATPTATPTETEAPVSTAAATEEPADETEATTDEPDSEAQATETAGAAAEEEAATETTETQFPGLGITVTLVAFVMAVLALLRRRLD